MFATAAAKPLLFTLVKPFALIVDKADEVPLLNDDAFKIPVIDA